MRGGTRSRRQFMDDDLGDDDDDLLDWVSTSCFLKFISFFILLQFVYSMLVDVVFFEGHLKRYFSDLPLFLGAKTR